MSGFDPRLTAARGDLAAASLRGRVAAERFVEGRRCQVTAGVLDLRRQPRSDAPLDTQVLHGETVLVFDEADGWAWVQAELDDYVGYVPTRGLSDAVAAPTHRIVANRTFVYPAPDMKRPPTAALPLAARVTVRDAAGLYARLADGGFVYAAHLAAMDATACADPVSAAEALLGTPYLWGGRSPLGIDCSGLVQVAFAMAGVALPRDTHMQEARGRALPSEEPGDPPARGDLIFWPGHVGILTDSDTLLHANAHHMMVKREPLRAAVARIAAGPSGTPVRCVRRAS